jgi:hypothetical protein
MAGAAESSLSAAMEEQAKTLETQSRLLQQICDRLDAQDRHWQTLERVVSSNAQSITVLTAKMNDIDVSTVQSDLARSFSLQIDAHVAEIQATSWERIDAVDGALSTGVAALEATTDAITSWRPYIEQSVGVVHSNIEGLRSELQRSSDRWEHERRAPTPLQAAAFGSTMGCPPAATRNVEGHWRHHDANPAQEGGFRYPHAHNFLPTNGMAPGSNSIPPAIPHLVHDAFGSHPHSQFDRPLGNIPKVPFPGFDGENPKLWQTRCQDYFTMYSVDPSVWIRIARMHFTGSAARWL